MSDFGWGVRATVEAANGGQDMEMCCTEFFGDKLVDAVKQGLVSESKVNEAALRIIRTLLSFQEDSPKVSESVLGCKEHISLALESARKGITLLKNNNSLPLKRGNVKKILLLGKKAISDITGDHGSSHVHPAYTVTSMKGISEVAGDCEVIYYSGEDINHAKELSKLADAVVFVVGYDHNDEGEYVSNDQNFTDTGTMGGDRYSLELHPSDIKLIQAVAPTSQNSIVVLIGGNLIMLESWKESVDSILMAYYPGMEGGTAIGDIIFGNVNPSGKLPYVVPYNEKDLPQVNWDTDYQFYEYYHGYAKLEHENKEPSLPYGFGLSYTTFKYSNASFYFSNNQIKATCYVENSGSIPGDEVVQMYIGFKNSEIDRPVKLLRGFSRVSLNPGENKIVEISCPESKLCFFNHETGKMELENIEYEVFIGSSSDNKDLLSGSVSLCRDPYSCIKL